MPLSQALAAGLLLAITAYLAGCASEPVPPPVAEPSTPPPPPPEAPPLPPARPIRPEPPKPLPPREDPAVRVLIDRSRSEASAGKMPAAIATLERALRIEPRNPLLWQELAQLQLRKGDYRRAENFAVRSNSFAGANRSLVAANWRIIGEARSKRGDAAGAKAAFDKAKGIRAVAE